MDTVEPDSAETRGLLDQAAAGDQQAFERLFARHRKVLRDFVEGRLDPRVRARVDPSDVVQETQLEAFRRLEDYLQRRPMPFRVWLRKTAYQRLNKARRFHQAARRSVGREEFLPDRSSMLLVRRILAGGPEPGKRLTDQDLAGRVRQVLDRLAGTDREILLLHIVDELPYEEVGYLLDIEPATARKRFGRALLRLRKLLGEEGLLESQS
jgi:RNA polymerase sigma-70 factor (ECF subfamily)